MENHYFDKQLQTIIGILEHDYAGLALGERIDFQYYIQAAGMAWKERKLDQLLFMRYVSQMLATSMDRNLRLSVTSEEYRPWHAGFDTRRIGDVLYVTGSTGDHRLRAGDRIVLLNGRSPGEHRACFQKNFLYGQEAEREIWSNVLKMADRMTVEHADNTREELPVLRLPGSRPVEPTLLDQPAKGVVRIQAGSLDDPEQLEKLVAGHQPLLDEADLLIIDLRRATGDDPAALLPLVPYILSDEKTLNEAEGTRLCRTLYTRDNCLRRLEQLRSYQEIPEATQLIRETEEHFGAGWMTEPVTWWDDLPQPVTPRGNATVILTDTWTEGAPESFVRLAEKEGRARIAGRATMGNLDFTTLIRVQISETAVLTYPIAIFDDAVKGNGICGRGIVPDQVIPFTPEECVSDVILNAVIR